VAAQTWWAAIRRRPHAPARLMGPGSEKTTSTASTAALLPFAAVLLLAAATGFLLTQREDSRQTAERHAALQRALDEVRGAAGSDVFDARQLPLIAQRAGLPGLRFDADAVAPAHGEVQSLHDGQGRIVGWFSWQPDRAMIDDLEWLWGAIGAVGLALGFCALGVRMAMTRLRRKLAADTSTIRKLTSEDMLTGLPNHRVMLDQLKTKLAQRGSRIVVLALVDLDGFREVNDTQGRDGGDALMRHIAERLAAALPPGAVLGRFEDDEFAVILDSDDVVAAARLAETLRAALARPIFLEQMWQISAGIGLAQAPADGDSATELSRRAGLALRAAKHAGRGSVQHFEAAIEMEDSEERFMRRELQSAIAAGALDVHYQPVVAAAGGGIVGVEALLRWTHPKRGAIAPSVFIPLAEQSGLMLQLGEFVLRRALADGARWPGLTVAINLSPLQIRDPKIVHLVGNAMSEAGIASSRVILEVTESVLIDDPHDALSRLDALRGLGVRIALDDFGTGYSSLSYLQRFPFSLLKIDQAFVASLGSTGNAGAIVQSIVTLGHALGMKVLAEGVETDEQRVLLRLAGCDEMQGFLFAKPLPAEAIDRLAARPVAGRATRPRSAQPAR
jgi:diguanylate cyclase (GGDEF)-like protein